MNHYFSWFGLPGSFVLTILLSLLALVLALLSPSPSRWFCFAAMAASSIGDIFLMRFHGLERIFPNYFVIGAAFFMLAHLLYFNTYRLLAKKHSYPFMNTGVIIIAVIAVICLVYFTVICTQRAHFDWRRYFLAMIYLCMISLGSSMIFSYSFSHMHVNPFSLIAAIGALSFLISDLIIGLGLLAGIPRFDHLIWWFYPIGQVLIILFAF